MLRNSKLILAAAVLATTFAAPAFAQSVDHTGTLFASHYGPDGKQQMGSWAAAAPQASARQASHRDLAVQGRGLYSYATVPAAPYSAPAGGYDGSIASQR